MKRKKLFMMCFVLPMASAFAITLTDDTTWVTTQEWKSILAAEVGPGDTPAVREEARQTLLWTANWATNRGTYTALSAMSRKLTVTGTPPATNATVSTEVYWYNRATQADVLIQALGPLIIKP